MSPKRRPGHPTRLTHELVQKCATVMRTGVYVDDACAFLGLHVDSWYEWLRRGKASRRAAPVYGLSVNEQGQTVEVLQIAGCIYREFSDSVTKAQAEVVVLLSTKLVTSKGSPEWLPALKFLERRYPRKYGVQIRVSVEHELSLFLDDLEKEFADEPKLLERVLRVVARRAGGEEAERLAAEESRSAGLGPARLLPAAGVHPEGDAGLPEPDPPDPAD